MREESFFPQLTYALVSVIHGSLTTTAAIAWNL